MDKDCEYHVYNDGEFVQPFGENTILDYVETTKKKMKTFERNNSTMLCDVACQYDNFMHRKGYKQACLDSYPSQRDSYEYITGQKSPYGARAANGVPRKVAYNLRRKEPNPLHMVPQPTVVNESNQSFGFPPRRVEGFGNLEFAEQQNPNSFANMQSVPGAPKQTSGINDPTNELLEMDARPLRDFVHNNFVPYYGGRVKQNMAGTGVSSGDYVDDGGCAGDVNNGFDYTSPFQNKLDMFTGLEDTYLHKRETGPKFSPAEQQTGWVYGMPDFRPDDDRYKQSLFIRNDLKPCEQQLVGPGLNVGAEVPATGGYHDPTRVLPNNVNNYKANQLEGRTNAGKFALGGNEPTAYPGVGVGCDTLLSYNNSSPGVVKNRPDSFWSQVRRPTMTTKASDVFENIMRPDYNVDKKPGNAKREQGNYGFGQVVRKGECNPRNPQCNITDYHKYAVPFTI